MKSILAASALALLSGTAFADVNGVWRTETNDEGGYAHVNIAACADAAGKLCGTITDAFNEVPANLDQDRRATLVGKVMINAMSPDGEGRWRDGTIWAPDDDKTYRSKMKLDGSVLKVSGCVFGGLICRGQDWVRVE